MFQGVGDLGTNVTTPLLVLSLTKTLSSHTHRFLYPKIFSPHVKLLFYIGATLAEIDMRILSFFRPRYSLRAILVVMTAFALFLWYHINWIQQRRAAINSQMVHPYHQAKDNRATRAAPAMLGMFSEPGYFRLMVNVEEDDPEFDRIRAIFPEAQCKGYICQGGLSP